MSRTGKVIAIAIALSTPFMSVEAHRNGNGNEFIEGSGWVVRSGQKLLFGIAAVCKEGSFEGHFQFKDKSLGMRFKNAEIVSVAPDGEDARIIEGYGVIEGVSALPGGNDEEEVSFRVGVIDNGEPGKNTDALWIEFNSGYFVPETLLGGGNIMLHSHPGDAGCSVTQPDNTPPVVTLTAPADGATVSASVEVAANASDDSDVAGVQFLVDGAAIGTEDSSAPYAVDWNTSSVANGSHTLTAMARDDAGNTASANISVYVDNDSGGTQVRVEEDDPAVAYAGTWLTINDPRASAGSVTESNEADATATLSFEGTGVSWIGFRCSCAAGIANVYVDGTLVDTVDTHGPDEPRQDEIYSVSGLPDGSHTFTVEITGEFNREGSSAYVIIDAFDITR